MYTARWLHPPCFSNVYGHLFHIIVVGGQLFHLSTVLRQGQSWNTLPETDSTSAPENWWLEDDPSVLGQKAYFQRRTASFKEGKGASSFLVQLTLMKYGWNWTWVLQFLLQDKDIKSHAGSHAWLVGTLLVGGFAWIISPGRGEDQKIVENTTYL